MIKYRVIIKVSYSEAWFEFEVAEQACAFATNALTHMVSCEDTKKKTSINLQVVNTDAEEEEDA